MFKVKNLVGLMLLASAFMFAPKAEAVPSFAIQTGNPCSACHVGAFGPQLTSFGRDFKLYGYTASDKQNHFPPLTFMTQLSYGRTQADAPAGTYPEGSRNNDNWAFNENTIYLAGALVPDHVGAFIQGSYEGVNHVFKWNTMDVRYVHDAEIFGEDTIWGLDINNNPTASDIWNSTPNWGFPYVNSPWALNTTASTIIDNALALHVVGTGGYLMWNDLVYLEGSAYQQLGVHEDSLLNGEHVVQGLQLASPAPYWRAAIQQSVDNGKQYFMLGTYGLSANVNPGGDHATGHTDHFNDFAFDANYQWYASLKNSADDVLSVHATWIHENGNVSATAIGNNGDASGTLVTRRADITYAVSATWVPIFEYFKTNGSNTVCPAQGLSCQTPNTEGWIAEVGFVPWGKKDSPVNWANAKLVLQYTNYMEFNGTSTHASDNNTVLLNLWVALGLNPF